MSKSIRSLFVLLAILSGITCSPLQAKLVTEIIKVPVTVKNGFGREFAQDIVVTVFFDDSIPGPHPILVIGHGRAAHAEQRTGNTRQQYSANSRWFAQLGFLVAVPTRIGYGVSGGEDLEDTGGCKNKIYPPGYEAAAVQELQALEAMRQRPDTLKDHSVVIGQSYGGATAIAVAAKNPPGVQLAINFAGGGGGNPETQAEEPCAPHRLKQMFGDYGKTSRIPTLWVYTENDQWMGHKYPKEWFDAFREAGGAGEFVQFGPVGKDGHVMFSTSPETWHAKIYEFLKANGFPDLPALPAPPASK